MSFLVQLFAAFRVCFCEALGTVGLRPTQVPIFAGIFACTSPAAAARTLAQLALCSCWEFAATLLLRMLSYSMSACTGCVAGMISRVVNHCHGFLLVRHHVHHANVVFTRTLGDGALVSLGAKNIFAHELSWAVRRTHFCVTTPSVHVKKAYRRGFPRLVLARESVSLGSSHRVQWSSPHTRRSA